MNNTLDNLIELINECINTGKYITYRFKNKYGDIEIFFYPVEVTLDNNGLYILDKNSCSISIYNPFFLVQAHRNDDLENEIVLSNDEVRYEFCF